MGEEHGQMCQTEVFQKELENVAGIKLLSMN